ncbi:MAG: YtxH domain-containing protein [Ginsengibacter sp.]
MKYKIDQTLAEPLPASDWAFNYLARVLLACFLSLNERITLLKTLLKILKITTMSSGKVLASVLAGAAAGVILGILFAPEKGVDTRRKIAEKGSDAADSVKSKYNEFADTISDKYDSAKQKLSSIVSEGRDMGKDIVDQAKEKANAMKNDIRNPNPVS